MRSNGCIKLMGDVLTAERKGAKSAPAPDAGLAPIRSTRIAVLTITIKLNGNKEEPGKDKVSYPAYTNGRTTL